MLKILAFCFICSAAAQQPTANSLPPPPVVPIFSAEEMVVVREAMAKLTTYLLSPQPGSQTKDNPYGQPLDPSYGDRARAIDHEIAFTGKVSPTSLPGLMMALSRSSNDPKACALLKRIEPSAVCMK